MHITPVRTTLDFPFDEWYVWRFFKRVDTSDLFGCWPWRGMTTNRGYGIVKLSPYTIAGIRAKVCAHRVALYLVTGVPILSSEVVYHDCDNPSCCNPMHLYQGTQSDNMQDCFKKGRMPPKLGIIPYRYLRYVPAKELDHV